MYSVVRLKKKLIVCIACVLAVTLGAGIVWGQQVKVANAPVEGEGRQIPIVMYHGLLKERSRQGKYVISPDTFEEDLKYLKEHGYTTVVMQDLIDYVYNGKELPPKPIVISFDDGYYNNYYYAFPLLKQYNCKMVLSPIGKQTDLYSEQQDTHPNYSHVTWDNINEMMQSGLVEFQNHTYDLHKSSGERIGAKKSSGETVETYKRTLTDDVMLMQQKMKENTGYTPTTFVYPFGAVSEASNDILKEMGFLATLGCESKINVICKNEPDSLFMLGRYLRPAGQSSEVYFTKTMPLS